MQAFGRYEIVRRIGVGGMGEVYYAYAYGVARTKKPVVVKVLRGEMLSEPGAPEMFVEEGRLSLGLSHSNILQVFDFGKADDRYFMAMEYVDGLHLGELRKKSGGKLPAEVAAFVCMEVCLGLDYAHRLKDDQGQPLHIVHRDVTPSNILISREGEVKLADFGIARAVGRSQHTQAGQIRGKVRYMSPEAARGEPLDHRTDLFSLGAIFFELLTGRRAFDAKGGREKILQQIVSTRAPAPSEIAGTHPALDAIVLTATAPKRDDRFPDAFAMHRAIEEACQAASLRPSRGAFLGFLRELESRPPAEGPSWHSGSTRPPRAETPPEPSAPKPAPEPPPVSPSGKVRQPVPSTPSGKVRQPAPTSGSGKVRAPDAPPAGSSGKVPRSPAAAMTPATPATPTAPTQTPDVSRSRAGVPWPSASDLPAGPTVTGAVRPSSVVGAVPPEHSDPDSRGETALKTGVAAPPVLFTLTMHERDRESGGAVAHFEVTRFEPTPALEARGTGSMLDDDADEPGDAARSRSQPVAMIEDDETPGAGSAATIPPIDAASGLSGGEVIRIGERSVSRRLGARNGSGPKPVEAPADLPTQGRAPVATEPSGAERESLPSAETVVVPRDPMSPPGEDAGSRSGLRSPAPGHTDDLHASEEPVAEQEISERWRVRKELTGEREIGERESASQSDLFPATAPPSRTANPAYYWLAGLALAGMVVIGLAIAKLGSGPAATPTPRDTPFAFAIPSTPKSPPTAAPTRAFVVVTPTAAPTRLAIATPTPRPTHVATPTARVVSTPAPSSSGLVDINSDPWSEVRLGSRLLGNTPLREVRLPVGRQVLSLRNPRTGKVKTVEIDVQSGQNRPVLVNLN